MKKVLILILAVILSLSVFAMAACQQPCETHVDGNHDGICDVCETEGLTVTHTDTNHDGKCDGCGGATTYEHTDATHDGKCDVCNKSVEVVHIDADGDGYCDVTACGHKYTWVDALASAKEYVDGLYLNADEITSADYTITTVVAIGGVTYNVDWEIQSDVAGQTAVALGEIDSTTKQQTVDVDEFSAEEVAYTLVATISDAEGHSVKVEYGRKVNKFVVSTYAEYLAHCDAADGVTFTIRAYVIGAVSTTSSSKGSLYLQDADGNGYYAYKPSLPSDVTASEEALDAYFPFGTEVCVTGTGTRYGGQYEFNSGCTVVKTGNVAEEGVLTFENVTEAWGSAKNQGDHDVLAGDQNKLVVIEEAIFTKFDGSYYYFTVNGVTYNIYKTNYFMAEQADIDALFAKFEAGKAATIKGIVSCYSNLYQIYPLDVDCISNVHAPELSDAQKVAVAMEALTLADAAKQGDAIELPATGANETTIAWALDGTYDIATLADGTLTITATPSSTTKIKLVATITSGSASDTKTFEITVAGATFDLISLTEAAKIGAAKEHNTYTEDKYYVLGIIKEVYNTKYGNMYIKDENGNELTVYGTYSADGSTRYDSMENAPVAGDVVIVYGILGQYNGTAQMKNAWIVASYDVKTIPEATEIGAAKEHNTYTEDKYYVLGIIKEVYNTKYGNMYIKDADGNELTVYGTYSVDGSTRYDSMENAPVAGDVVIVYGVLGQYNGTAQMKNAWIVVVAPAGEATSTVHTCESVCETCGKCLDAECTEEACAEKCEGHENVDNAPVAGTYVLSMYQSKNAVELYLVAEMSGHYIASTQNQADAAFITLAKLDNGNYTMQLSTGKYLAIVQSGTYFNAVMQDTACEWAWNSTYNTLTVTIGGAEYYLGTYSTFTTFGASNISYAATSYVAHLTAVDPVVPPVEEHKCESVCPTCGKCLDAECTEEACAEKCEGHEVVAAVVINGTKYTEAEAEAALLALNAGDVVEILADVTIAKEYTFVAGTYTVGEGVTFLFQANAVAPAGAKLTVGANAKIIVEAGVQLDLSALTQDDFATSTSARLEIANGAKVTMPAYTEQLWNDVYLNAVIQAMVADSDFGAKLVLGETTLTKTHAGWVAPSTTVVETLYTLQVPAKGSSWSTDTLINDIFYVSNKVKTESVKIDGATYDGLTFSSQFSLTAGKVQVNDGVWANSIFFTVPAGQSAKVVVYAAQKSDKNTTLKVMNAAGEEVAVTGLMINDAAADAFDTLPKASVSKYEFTLAEGTYHIGGAGGGAYVYGMNVTLCEKVAGHACETICLECGKCLDAECTESACAEKCAGHAITTIAGALAAEDGVAVELTGTVTGYYGNYKNNFYIQDTEGNSILVYYSTANANLGDVVKVVGTLGSYNGTKQIAKGSTFTVVEAHVCSTWTDATCTEAAVCTVCGTANGEALGHTYVDGACSVCGAEEPAGNEKTVSLSIFANQGTLENKVITWVSDNVTVSVAQAGNNNAIRTTDADHFRVYQANEMDISISDGTLTKVVITCQSASYATVLAGSLTSTGATATTDGSKVIVTVTGLTVIEFTTTAQARITAVEVTYVPAE